MRFVSQTTLSPALLRFLPVAGNRIPCGAIGLDLYGHGQVLM
jgi:hypothetical protein